MDALVKNAADPDQVKEAGSKVKSRREKELKDVAQLLDTEFGRRFIWRYLSECGVYKLSLDQNPVMMAFNEGTRNIGLKIIADVTESSPQALIKMMQEFNKENS